MEYKELKKKIRVKAISPGYHGSQVKNHGDVFEVERQLFSHNWMVAIDSKGVELSDQPRKLDNELIHKVLKVQKDLEDQEELVRKAEAKKALDAKRKEEEEAEAQKVLEAAEALIAKREADARVNPESVSKDEAGGVDSLI